jgi:hypothetical protein
LPSCPLSSHGGTEQEIWDRKQETEQEEEFRKDIEKRIRIEANLPVLYRLREDGTGNKG